jgi:hypothetical protein
LSKTVWALVAHVCNPSYSGGRDQKDHSWQIVLGDPNLKKPSAKKGLEEWLKV